MEVQIHSALPHEELVHIILNQGDLTEQLLQQLTSVTGNDPQVALVPASTATIDPLGRATTLTGFGNGGPSRHQRQGRPCFPG